MYVDGLTVAERNKLVEYGFGVRWAHRFNDGAVLFYAVANLKHSPDREIHYLAYVEGAKANNVLSYYNDYQFGKYCIENEPVSKGPDITEIIVLKRYR